MHYAPESKPIAQYNYIVFNINMSSHCTINSINGILGKKKKEHFTLCQNRHIPNGPTVQFVHIFSSL